MVGGEQMNNVEVKERRKKRKTFAEERKRKLAGKLFLLTLYKSNFFMLIDFLFLQTFVSFVFIYFFCMLHTVSWVLI